MNVRRLDHINIRTANLQELSEFYCGVLGLNPGPRPSFPFPGAWLYCDGFPVLHLVGVDEQPRPSGLQLEHFAFEGADILAFVSHLEAKGVAYRKAEVPGFGVTQVNVHDPDGNHFHVDFTDARAVTGEA